MRLSNESSERSEEWINLYRDVWSLDRTALIRSLVYNRSLERPVEVGALPKKRVSQSQKGHGRRKMPGSHEGR